MGGRRYVTSKPKRQLPHDPARRHQAEQVGVLLVEIGRQHGEQFPWHHTTDPFRVLVAEFLLSRTSRSTVERVYKRLFKDYKDAKELSRATPEHLAEITREAGLSKKTAGLREIAQRVSEAGGVSPEREWLLELPFVGDYIADAVRLYAFREHVVPLDRNFQRVIHRIFFNQEPPKRSIEPYRDPETVYVVDEMTEGLDITGLRHFHQGVLVVAWDYCRYQPRIGACPLRGTCLFAQQSVR